MKKLILSTLLLLLFTQTLMAQVIEKTVKWSCPHLPYENVVALPEEEYIAVILSYDRNGDAKLKFKPNIFSDDILKSAKKIFNSIIYKEKEPDYIVDYSNCVEDFLAKYEEEIIKENKKCKNCIKNPQAVLTNLNDEIYSDKNSKRMKNKTKVPAFVPFHNLKLYSSKEFERIYKSICADEQLTNNDLAIATSLDMANQVQRWASDLKSKYPEECLQNYVNLNKAIEKKNDCLQTDCNFLKRSSQDKEINGEEILATRTKSIHDKEKDMIINNRIFLGSDFSDDIKTKLFNSFTKGGYCYFNNTRGKLNSESREVNVDINDTPELLEQFLVEKDLELSRSCKTNILNNLLARYYTKEDPAKSEFCIKYGCPELKKRMELYDELIESLIGNLYGDSRIEYYCENRSELREGNEVYKKVDALLTSLEQINQCTAMKPGEHKVIDDSGYKTPSGIEMKYLLEQKTEKDMQATVAINFGDDEKGNEMLGRVKECLEITSSYFKGGNGSTINVKIIGPEEVKNYTSSKRPPIVDVKIGSNGMRSNSHEYAADANCATMTHEVLHLMGLCDEYEENATGYYVDTETGEVYNKDIGPEKVKEGKAKFTLAYNACRSVPKDVSIMKHHWEALSETVKTQNTCECNNVLCEKIVSSDNTKYMDIMLNDPWNDIWRFKNDCKQQFVNSSSIKDLSSLDLIKNPIELIESKENSITFFDHEFYSGGMGASSKASYTKRKYTCSCNKAECKDEFNKLKDRAQVGRYTNKSWCPSGSESKGHKNVKDDEAQGNNFAKIDGKSFQLIKTPARSSLLQPAQFARIKWGSCAEKVKNYSKCAQNAYKALAKDCPDIPPYCKDEEQWLKNTY